MLFFSHLPSWFTKIPNPLLCNLRNGVHVTISSFARSKISSSLSAIISAASPIWNLANWRLDHETSCSLADFGLYPVSIWIFPLKSFCVKSRHSTSDESIRRNLWPSNLKSLILKWVDNEVSSLAPSIKRGFLFSCSNSAGYEYSSLSLVGGAAARRTCPLGYGINVVLNPSCSLTNTSIATLSTLRTKSKPAQTAACPRSGMFVSGLSRNVNRAPLKYKSLLTLTYQKASLEDAYNRYKWVCITCTGITFLPRTDLIRLDLFYLQRPFLL